MLFGLLLVRLNRLPTFERRVGLIQLATLMVAITPLGWHQHKAAWLVLALLAAWSQALALPRLPATAALPTPSVLRRPLAGAARVTVR
jgi:hypothetical protein